MVNEADDNATGPVGPAWLGRLIDRHAAALASFRPRPSRVDRDRVMFLAGRESAAGNMLSPAAASRAWAWPGAFTAMTALAAALLVLLLRQPDAPVDRGTLPATVRGADQRRTPPVRRPVTRQPVVRRWGRPPNQEPTHETRHLGTVPIFAKRKWDCPLPSRRCR